MSIVDTTDTNFEVERVERAEDKLYSIALGVLSAGGGAADG